METPSILVAMPLHEGWDHVGETLASIAAQTYRNFRVLISVDGNDERSRAACGPVADDPRFEIVLHRDRLFWEGNMNWLVDRLAEDFFCYWQHDDHCEPDYLETLAEHAAAHPEAAAIYCDMDMYGEMEKIVRRPSTTGFALERVIDQANNFNPAVIRCLVRADAMRRATPITHVFAWGMAIARVGELHRVPRLMYHRRIRREALTFTLRERPPAELWRHSLEWALSWVRNTYELVQPDERPLVFASAIDKLVNQHIHRKWLYDFEGADAETRLRFVREFLALAEERFGWKPYPDTHSVTIAQQRHEYGLAPGEDLILRALSDRSN